MAKQQMDSDRSNDLDNFFRPSSHSAFARAALTDDEREYSRWYARLLSSLTLMTAGSDLVYAQAALSESGIARVDVFTSSLFVTSIVETISNPESIPVRAIARKAIESLSVAASQAVDTQGSQSYAWPGTIRIEARFVGLEDAIVVEGDALERSRPNEKSAIWHLLDALRSDLAPKAHQ